MAMEYLAKRGWIARFSERVLPFSIIFLHLLEEIKILIFVAKVN